MKTDESYITVQHPFKNISVVTVERVGTGGRNTLSSSNTDHIPKKIRQIFDEPDTEKWVVVYYLTADSHIIARATFLFEGRDKVYKEVCEASVSGTLARVVIVFRTKTKQYDVGEGYLRTVKKGQPFKMTINGEIIP